MVPLATTPDPINHVACATTSSFSPFAVFYPIDVAAQLQQLQHLINSFNLRKPAARRFTHRLDDARRAWAMMKHHRHCNREFCEELEEFVRAVRKGTGRSLTAAEADQLLQLAAQIAAEVGCR